MVTETEISRWMDSVDKRGIRSLIRIAIRPMLAPDEAIYLQASDLEPVKTFLKNALRMKGEAQHYRHIVQQLRARDDAEMLWRLYISMGCCVHQITQKPDMYRELIQGVYTFNWIAEKRIIVAFVELLGQLVTSNPIFLLPSLQLLVRSLLIPENKTIDSITKERQERIHQTLNQLLILAPSGLMDLPTILTDHFPHRRYSETTLTDYVHQLLVISTTWPTLQYKLFELIISKTLEIDVEILVEDSGDVRIAEDDTEKDLMFQLEDTKDVSDTANKLDAMLHVFREHITLLLARPKEQQDKLYHNLLLVFETRILLTHKSKYTQFILFYTALKSPTFASLFAFRLLELFLNIKNHMVVRQSAVLYLSSLLARGTFLANKDISEILQFLLQWSSNYIQQSGIESANMTTYYSRGNKRLSLLQHIDEADVPKTEVDSDEFELKHDFNRHELFYCGVQAVCYVLCFHGVELCEATTNNLWDIVINNPLQPLKYCLQSVRVEFLRLANHVGLFSDTTWKALPADLLWQNKTTLLGSGYNPLDSFFPFDPCLLRRLNASIDGGYRLWRGIPGIGDVLGPKTEILDTGHRGGIPLPQQFQEAPDVITEDVSIESSSMASSLAYTYTDGIAMSLASNSSFVKKDMMTFSPSSYSDMMSAGSFVNGSVMDNMPRVLEKRPRQFSVGSAGSW